MRSLQPHKGRSTRIHTDSHTDIKWVMDGGQPVSVSLLPGRRTEDTVLQERSRWTACSSSNTVFQMSLLGSDPALLHCSGNSGSTLEACVCEREGGGGVGGVGGGFRAPDCRGSLAAMLRSVSLSADWKKKKMKFAQIRNSQFPFLHSRVSQNVR